MCVAVHLCRVVLLALVAVSAPAAAFEVSFRLGDDPAWAAPDYDDSAWERRSIATLPSDEIFWTRHELVVPADLEAPTFFVSALASTEIYWDGHLVGSNGVVGRSAEEEVPGQIEAYLSVPPSLATPGPHLVAVRASTFHRRGELMSTWYRLDLLDLDPHELTFDLQTHGPLVVLGAIVLAGVVLLVGFVADSRRPSIALLGLLCLLVAALQVAESWRFLFGYPYDAHLFRLRLISGLTLASGVTLVAFVGHHLQLFHGRLAIAGFTATLVAIGATTTSFDEQCTRMALGALALATVIAARGVAVARPGALGVLASVAAALLVLLLDRGDFLDHYFFYVFAVLIGCLLVVQTRQTRALRERHQRARLTAARLELELLKRQIQPHFMMNTLTTLIEWVETAPADAVRLIEALADELRILSAMAHESLVPARTELELCRAHLAVMSCRQGVELVLRSEGVDETEMVPPAIFHTVLENAVTHNDYQGGPIEFELGRRREGSWSSFRIVTPAGRVRGKRGGGTGMRYVEARLEESYGERWRLEHVAADGGWVTTIDLPVGEG